MKFDRVVIESGDNQTVLDLHPRLTVVTGLGALERDGLVGELVGALGSARSGVHLELTADNGRHFAIFRPDGAGHRVVDVDDQRDVTGQFVDDGGRIDLLARAGLDHRGARRTMRVSARSLAEAAAGDELVAGLARLDQQALWTAAELLVRSRDHLDEEAGAAGTSAEDAEVVARIEQRHEEFERSQEQGEGVRKVSFVLAGLAALASLPVVQRFGPGAVVPLAVAAVAAVTVSVVFWRRTESARRREEAALAEAGARSYLGFHLQRVNSLLGSDGARRRLLRAAEEHRAAAARWTALAGDVEVDWALAHRAEVAAAAQVRAEVRPVGPRGSTDPVVADDVAAMAHALLGSLQAVRDVGGTGESFPLLVDEPFDRVDPTAVPALLELLVRSSEQQQVVVLTEDDTVEGWARLEAMTGGVAVRELRPTVRAA